MHALDFDDTLLDSLLHVSSVVVPVVLAVGDATDASGADALVAAAAAYEVAARLGAAAGRDFHRRGFHATGVLGPLFGTIAAARLYGLTSADAVAAVGLAGSMGSGLLEFLSDGSGVKRLHPGWAAHGSVLAARLAPAGLDGPASILEGPRGVFAAHLERTGLDALGDGLGRRWLSREVSFKLYPCAHVLHPFIGAVLDLRLTSPVRRIVATVPELEAALFDRPAVSGYGGRASLRHVLAAAAVDGRVDESSFTPAALERGELVELAAAVEIRAGDPPALRVELVDGTWLDGALTAEPAGDDRRDALLAKFERNASAQLTAAGAARLRDAVLDLQGRAVGDVLELARSAEPAAGAGGR